MVDMRRSSWSFRRSYLEDTEAAPFGPSIISVDPDNGTTAGGTVVTLTTSGAESLSITDVFIGSQAAEDLSFLDTGVWSALTPPSVTGTGAVDVTMYFSDLSTATLTDGFTYT